MVNRFEEIHHLAEMEKTAKPPKIGERLPGTPTRVDDFYGREERVAMAYRQLAEEHPEAFRSTTHD